jgi:hypothetical protein
MKISIGINIHGAYKRQDQCIFVLKKLKQKYPNINLYNITFSDEFNFEKDFIHLPFLNKTASEVVPNSCSNKPIAHQFFDILSKTDCDYFLFLNSDILLTEKVIKLITDQYETYCFSRTDVLSTNKLSEIVPWRIEIAGFDAWAVKKDWWITNSELFEDEYVYAEHLWDVFFTLTMFNHSKCMLCNKENYIIHEKHDLNWTESSPEATHNSNLWNKSPYGENWKKFIYENLIKRQPIGQFLTPLDNETELEQKFLLVK